MNCPLYTRPGGLKTQERERKQYRPIATAVLLFGPPPPPEPPEEPGAGVEEEEEEEVVRVRSPRIMTSGCITVLPPSMMFWVPTRLLLRATLLPVS